MKVRMIRTFFNEVSLASVFSVWRRHLAVYRKTWLTNLIPPISEPVLFLIGFGLGFAPLVSHVAVQGRSLGYLEFLAPGMIGTGVLYQSFFESVYGTFIRIKFNEIWQGMLTAPLSFGDIFLGDLLWATTKGAVTGLITWLVAAIWGILEPSSIVVHFPWIVAGSLVFAGLGMLCAGIVRTIDEINVPCFLLVIPMPLFCGVYFPRDLLPSIPYHITGWIPLTALVEAMRAPLMSAAVPIGRTMLVLALWFSVFIFPAAALLRRKVIK